MPIIPALTPAGFAHWATLHILSHPKLEARRVQIIVKDLPIVVDIVSTDGVPNKEPERLPRRISSSLFPYKENPVSRKLISDAVMGSFGDVVSEYKLLTTCVSPAPRVSFPPPLTSSRYGGVYDLENGLSRAEKM
jgi:hypothetical protein